MKAYLDIDNFQGGIPDANVNPPIAGGLRHYLRMIDAVIQKGTIR